MLARGANDLKLAPKKPLLVFGDDFSYFSDRTALGSTWLTCPGRLKTYLRGNQPDGYIPTGLRALC